MKTLEGTRLMVALGLALMLGMACTTADAVTDSRARGALVDIGGRSLFLDCRGEGGPAVVFVSGLGDTGYATWERVAPAVVTSGTACVYDRAGVGASDPASEAPTYAGAVADLHAVLETARIDGPYLLVGHSLGGLLARLYAERYPSEVAGLVLLDPTPVSWYAKLQRVLPPEVATAVAQNAEGFDLERGLGGLVALDAPGALGSRPLRVLWATGEPFPGLRGPAAAVLPGIWETEQVRMSSLSSAGRVEHLGRSGHYIPREQPELVVRVIEEMREDLRSGAV
jgi:pimeloyl-ACP methyl ester carboxylesterase